MSQQGTTVSGLMDALGIAVSLGLQYGVPIENYIAKFKGMKFEPHGITSNPQIRFCDSVVDYIAKYWEYEFLDDD